MTETAVAPPPAVGDTAADAVRLTRLRRMKLVALGLLRLRRGGVRRDARPGRVLGLRQRRRRGQHGRCDGRLVRGDRAVPAPARAAGAAHGADPARKDDFGKSLEEFFAENFLQEQVIRDRLAAGRHRPPGRGLAGRAGERRAGRARRRRPSLAVGLRRLKDEDVEAVVEEVLIPRFMAEPIAPVAGGLLQEIVADDAHHGLVDLALEEAHRWLVHNQETFTDVIGERAPWWAPDRLNDAVTNRLHLETVRWVADIRADPRPPRPPGAFDSLLAQLAQDLLHRSRRPRSGPRTSSAGCSSSRRRWPPACRCGARSAARCSQALDDADGPLRDARRPGAGRLRRPDRHRRRRCARRLDVWGSDFAVWAVDRYGEELTSVITRDHRALGRPGGRPPDRAARRSRPAVHPDQRHHRRRPRRRAHPRRVDWCSRRDPGGRRRGRRADPRRVDPARPVPQAGQPGRLRRRRPEPLIQGTGPGQRRGRDPSRPSAARRRRRRAAVGGRSPGAPTRRRLPSAAAWLAGSADVDQVDDEDQRLAGLDDAAGAAVAVAEVRAGSPAGGGRRPSCPARPGPSRR